MNRKHAREWNDSYPEQHYVSPLGPGEFLWESLSKYKNPGDSVTVRWIRDIMIEHEYTIEEIPAAIKFCIDTARILVRTADGMYRDPRPYGAFGPVYVKSHSTKSQE